MNYQLMINGFFPVSISKNNRLAYFEALKNYAIEQNLTDFINIVLDLEDTKINQYLSMTS